MHMTGFNKQSVEKIHWIRNQIEIGKLKAEIEIDFMDKYAKSRKTFYNLWTYVTRGKIRTDKKCSKMIDREINNQSNCFFCNNNLTIQHHISYYPQVIVYLCNSCHIKLHKIIKEYHNNEETKNYYIRNLEDTLKNVARIVSENVLNQLHNKVIKNNKVKK